MNENLIKLLEKIIQSKEVQEDLQKQENIDEAYQYCLSVQGGYSKEEFQNFLKKVFYINKEISKLELSEESLADVTGGFFLDSKKETKILGALLGSAMILPSNGLVNAQENNFYAQPTESSIVISEKISNDKNENNIIDNLSEKSREALSAVAASAEKFVGSVLDATSPKVEAMYYEELDDPKNDSSQQNDQIYDWSNPSNVPTASSLVYGQKLSESTLRGKNDAIQGKFVWKNGNIVPNAGTGYYAVEFIPSNNSYKTQSLKVKLTVQKATPSVSSWPSASDISFGDKLKDSELARGSANVPGKFVWQEGQVVPKLGKQCYTVLFKPDDNKNYFEVYNYVYVSVNKAKPKIYWKPAISPLYYGQNLSDAKFGKSFANVKGTFSWKKDEKNMKVGTYTRTVVFTPNDTKHYEKVEFDVSFKVEKAPVEIYEVPTASPIVFGESLSKSEISKVKSNVPGVLKWVEPNQCPPSGQGEFKAIFVPLDRKNYKPKSLYISVVVNKMTPKLDVRNINVEYTPQLTLEKVSLPKGWAWEMPSKRLDQVGEYSNLNVIYQGDSDYNSAVEKVTVFVDKGNPKVVIQPVNYEKNKTLDSIALPKGWHWNNPKELLSPEKSDYSARYDSKEAGTNVYLDQENVSVNITVNKSQPKIFEWAHPSKDIVFGDDLESVELIDGKSSEEGTFKFKDSVRDLCVGTHLCKVVFVPFDKGYNEVEGHVNVKIVKNNTPMNVPSDIDGNLATRSDTSINLNIDDRDNVYEYSNDGGKTWQDVPVFTNLTPKTEYKFVYRYKDTDSRCTGNNSNEVKISTKSNAPDAPTDLKIKLKTNHKIVFEDNEHLEYSIDEGNTWQDSPVFENLTGGTEYNFIARVKETDEHVAGIKSDVVKIKTYSWVSNVYHKIFG